MSPPDSEMPRGNEPLDARLRIDPNAVGEARWYLSEIDRMVFATADAHDADRHAERLKRAVAALFGRG